MLVVKVWGLPKLSEAELVFLHERIVEAAVSVKTSLIETEKDMMVWFPSDLMVHGLGENVLIEFSNSLPTRLLTIYSLAQKIGLALHAFLPNANVECHDISSTSFLWASE